MLYCIRMNVNSQKTKSVNYRIPLDLLDLIQKHVEAGIFVDNTDAVKAALRELPRIAAERQKKNEVKEA